ncbi:hypothetical protein CEW92_04905 [Bacillaceae bacterium SAS-127]|nr:hypothetical protein CEW92_04905 [Bacillaceae bacterium SAS-127]
MKLLFNEQMIECEQPASAEKVIEQINKLLQDQYYFNHFIADGEEVLEEPETFLVNNLERIDELTVVAIPAQQFINDLLLSAEEYTERAVSHITAVADEFYNHPSGASWSELSNLFEGMQWLAMATDTVAQSVACPSDWEEILAMTTNLQAELGNLEEALENTDTVLIADMLQYEVLPAFEVIAAKVKQIIDTEGMRHDLN